MNDHRKGPGSRSNPITSFSIYSYTVTILCLACAGCAAMPDAVLKNFHTEGTTAISYTPSGFAEQMAAARATAPAGFNVVTGPPFVILGDYPEFALARVRDRVILPVATAYWTTFLRERPKTGFRIYLFSTTEGYYEQTTRILGHKPASRLGLYSLAERAIFANTTVGYGWLCHEMWHALVDCDFPRQPSWLDEGMASLFEAPQLDGRRIRGRHNWRLWVLKQYRGAGKFVGVAELLTRRGRNFYTDPLRPLNYAEARYLCFYLQEKGRLAEFYRQFRDGHARDPSGAEALCRAAGVKDIDAFQKQWVAWLDALPDSEEGD